MRPLRALAIYILAVFIGGAMLAPLLYWVAQHFAHTAPKLASAPFHRYVDRSLLGIALIGLWPLVKNLGFTSFSEIGLVRPAGQLKRLLAGFLMGLVSLAVIAGIAFACHVRVLNSKLSGAEITHKLLGAAATAIVVGILEEILFRGALFGALRKVFHWIFALLASGLFYALMHYFKSADIAGPITWHSGLQLLPLMFQNLVDFHAMIPGFFNLTLAGILLGWAYQRTGNLYFSVGLHGGWIFWIKAYAVISSPAPQAGLWLWGSGSMAIVNGWIALPVLLLTLLVFAKLVPRKA
jgi:membrane protease YdiL (CAAX protease family)